MAVCPSPCEDLLFERGVDSGGVALAAHLEHKLAARLQRGADVRERGRLSVFVYPMQYGVRKDGVIPLFDLERRDVALEKHDFGEPPFRVGELRFRRVHALGVPASLREVGGQLPSAAAQIEHARPRRHAQQVDDPFAVLADERALFAVCLAVPLYVHLFSPEW